MEISCTLSISLHPKGSHSSGLYQLFGLGKRKKNCECYFQGSSSAMATDKLQNTNSSMSDTRANSSLLAVSQKERSCCIPTRPSPRVECHFNWTSPCLVTSNRTLSAVNQRSRSHPDNFKALSSSQSKKKLQR